MRSITWRDLRVCFLSVFFFAAAVLCGTQEPGDGAPPLEEVRQVSGDPRGPARPAGVPEPCRVSERAVYPDGVGSSLGLLLLFLLLLLLLVVVVVATSWENYVCAFHRFHQIRIYVLAPFGWRRR